MLLISCRWVTYKSIGISMVRSGLIGPEGVQAKIKTPGISVTLHPER